MVHAGCRAIRRRSKIILAVGTTFPAGNLASSRLGYAKDVGACACMLQLCEACRSVLQISSLECLLRLQAWDLTQLTFSAHTSQRCARRLASRPDDAKAKVQGPERVAHPTSVSRKPGTSPNDEGKSSVRDRRPSPRCHAQGQHVQRLGRRPVWLAPGLASCCVGLHLGQRRHPSRSVSTAKQNVLACSATTLREKL